MAILCVKYLAILKNESLPNGIKDMPKYLIYVAKY